MTNENENDEEIGHFATQRHQEQQQEQEQEQEHGLSLHHRHEQFGQRRRRRPRQQSEVGEDGDGRGRTYPSSPRPPPPPPPLSRQRHNRRRRQSSHSRRCFRCCSLRRLHRQDRICCWMVIGMIGILFLLSCQIVVMIWLVQQPLIFQPPALLSSSISSISSPSSQKTEQQEQGNNDGVKFSPQGEFNRPLPGPTYYDDAIDTTSTKSIDFTSISSMLHYIASILDDWFNTIWDFLFRHNPLRYYIHGLNKSNRHHHKHTERHYHSNGTYDDDEEFDDDDGYGQFHDEERMLQKHVGQKIVIIGGTDGSGTRAFVKLLQELGVLVIYDDDDTYDVHAEELFHKNGWPELIRRILVETHSANYQLTTTAETTANQNSHSNNVREGSSSSSAFVSNATIDILIRQGYKLRQGLLRRYKTHQYRRQLDQKDELQRERIHNQHRNHHQQQQQQQRQSKSKTNSNENVTFQGTSSLNDYIDKKKNEDKKLYNHDHIIPSEAFRSTIDDTVWFGMKAPVSMLALPLLRHIFPNNPITFIHVLRDGRDIALSQNQSPVLKFYQAMYDVGDVDVDTTTTTTKADDTIHTPSNTSYQQRLQKWSDDLYNVRAIQLWNDWNLQVYDYARQQIVLKNAKRKTKNDATTAANNNNAMEYVMVRSEDLISSSERKFQLMTVLANIVQSTLSIQQIACLIRNEEQDVEVGDNAKINNYLKRGSNTDLGRSNYAPEKRIQLQKEQQQGQLQQQQQQQHHGVPQIGMLNSNWKGQNNIVYNPIKSSSAAGATSTIANSNNNKREQYRQELQQEEEQYQKQKQQRQHDNIIMPFDGNNKNDDFDEHEQYKEQQERNNQILLPNKNNLEHRRLLWFQQEQVQKQSSSNNNNNNNSDNQNHWNNALLHWNEMVQIQILQKPQQQQSSQEVQPQKQAPLSSISSILLKRLIQSGRELILSSPPSIPVEASSTNADVDNKKQLQQQEEGKEKQKQLIDQAIENLQRLEDLLSRQEVLGQWELQQQGQEEEEGDGDDYNHNNKKNKNGNNDGGSDPISDNNDINNIKNNVTTTMNNNDNNINSKVSRRYGKWQRLLQDKPHVLQYLQQEGQTSLRLFGYYQPYVHDFYYYLMRPDQEGEEHVTQLSPSSIENSQNGDTEKDKNKYKAGKTFTFPNRDHTSITTRTANDGDSDGDGGDDKSQKKQKQHRVDYNIPTLSMFPSSSCRRVEIHY